MGALCRLDCFGELITFDAFPLDKATADLIADAEARAAHFVASRTPENRLPAFVPSNLWQVYQLLRFVREQELAAGDRFVEWGSGIGGVACVAAHLGLRSSGIEIEEVLVQQARQLAAEHGLDVDFRQGSYRPDPAVLDTQAGLNGQPGFNWAQADMVYAYPWPAELRGIEETFLRLAPEQSLLLLFLGPADIRIRRKCDLPDAVGPARR